MELSNKWVEDNTNKRFDVKMNGKEDLKNIRFFLSQGGTICYMNSRQKRKGRVFPYWDMVDTTELTPKPKPTPINNAKKLLNRIHPNAWEDLKEQIKTVADGGKIGRDFSDHFEDGLKFRSMKSIFGQDVVNFLELAFITKQPYSFRKSADSEKGRDYSVSIEIGDDGKLSAFFSSEYFGCCNGDYYLLLNPTTAVFYERD